MVLDIVRVLLVLGASVLLTLALRARRQAYIALGEAIARDVRAQREMEKARRMQSAAHDTVRGADEADGRRARGWGSGA